MDKLRPLFAWLSEQNLTGEELRILLKLLSLLSFDRFTMISQIELASEMRLHKTRISKAIKRFKELKILTVGTKTKQMNTYKLDFSAADDFSPQFAADGFSGAFESKNKIEPKKQVPDHIGNVQQIKSLMNRLNSVKSRQNVNANSGEVNT